MSNKEGYNGWTNWQTWNVINMISINEEINAYYEQKVRDNIDDIELLSDILEGTVFGWTETIRLTEPDDMEGINWKEIAESLIIDAGGLSEEQQTEKWFYGGR